MINARNPNPQPKKPARWFLAKVLHRLYGIPKDATVYVKKSPFRGIWYVMTSRAGYGLICEHEAQKRLLTKEPDWKAQPPTNQGQLEEWFTTGRNIILPNERLLICPKCKIG